MNIEERFLTYVSFDTQSDENSLTSPSTAKQLLLADYLKNEMLTLGLEEVRRDETGVVYGMLKANTPHLDKIGFIAHMDTSPEASGKDIKPQIIRNYQGGPIILNEEKRMVLDPAVSTSLNRLIGHDLITTDGNTLLGADDKAGIAIIMSAMAYLIDHPDIPHGDLYIAFTPDEEIGRGTDHFDLSHFKADYAYTVDGSDLAEYNYENFNAVMCAVIVNGKSYHPGDAKGKMINALTLARHFDTLLGDHDRPEHTVDREGFYHLDSINGTVSSCRMTYIVREHDAAKLEELMNRMKRTARYLNDNLHEELITLSFREQYKNMKIIIDEHPHIVKQVAEAMAAIGIDGRAVAVRGGTDGAMLSYKGLPCPNLGTGGYNYHGPYEFVSLTAMKKAVELLLAIVRVNYEKGV